MQKIACLSLKRKLMDQDVSTPTIALKKKNIKWNIIIIHIILVDNTLEEFPFFMYYWKSLSCKCLGDIEMRDMVSGC